MYQQTFIGRQLDDFIIQERLRQGTRATIYRAFQISVSREVGLKLAPLERTRVTDAAFHEQFKDAAAQIAALSHVHILPLYAYGIENGDIYLAMRMTNGATLDQRLEGGQAPDIAETVNIVTQIGRALGYAHRRGVIHYDMQPANILLDNTHNVYLTDFGLLPRLLENDPAVYLDPTTLQYIAPECLRDGTPPTPRSNVFSLGVLMYRMTTGQMLFPTNHITNAQVIDLQINGRPTRPRIINRDIPPDIVKVIMRALAPYPEDRFATTDDMVETLDKAMHELFTQAKLNTLEDDSSPKDAAALVRAHSQTRLLVFSVILTTIFVLVTLAYLMQNPPNIPPTIMEGHSANTQNIVPQPQIIRAARHNLGEDGFIAYVTCNRLSEFHAARISEITERAERYGLRVEVYNGGNNPSLEIDALNSAHEDGASAIIHCVIGEETIAETLRAVADDQIPLVVDNEAVTNGIDNVVSITRNDYSLGFVAGAAAGEYIYKERGGVGRVALLDYTVATRQAESERAQGLRDGLLANAPDVEVLPRMAGATPEDARNAMRRLIGDEVEFKAVLSVTDAGAYGVIRELDFAGYTPEEVAIFSIGGDSLARQFIDQGNYLRATATQNRSIVSDALLDAAVNLLGGGVIAESIVPPRATLYTGSEAE